MTAFCIIIFYCHLSTQPTQNRTFPRKIATIPLLRTKLASLVKGRWIDGTTQAVALLLSACDMSALFILQTFLPSRRRDCFTPTNLSVPTTLSKTQHTLARNNTARQKPKSPPSFSQRAFKHTENSFCHKQLSRTAEYLTGKLGRHIGVISLYPFTALYIFCDIDVAKRLCPLARKYLIHSL